MSGGFKRILREGLHLVDGVNRFTATGEEEGESLQESRPFLGAPHPPASPGPCREDPGLGRPKCESWSSVCSVPC